MIVTKVPGLDTPAAFARTGAVPITDIERSFDPDQPIVVINARTLERQLIWSELDANPADPRDVTLIVRPGRELRRGRALHRGAPQPARRRRPQDPAAACLQSTEGSQAGSAGRRAPRSLRAAVRNAQARRHQAQGALPGLGLHRRKPRGPERPRAPDPQPGVRGAGRPRPRPTSSPREASRPSRPTRTSRTMSRTRPSSTAAATSATRSASAATSACPASSMPRAARPARSSRSAPTACRSASPATRRSANVVCVIPKTPPPGPLRPSLYGHGLLGGAGEVTGGNVRAMANEHGFVFCATDWTGHVDARRAERARRCSRTCRASRRSRTAPSRAS